MFCTFLKLEWASHDILCCLSKKRNCMYSDSDRYSRKTDLGHTLGAVQKSDVDYQQNKCKNNLNIGS